MTTAPHWCHLAMVHCKVVVCRNWPLQLVSCTSPGFLCHHCSWWCIYLSCDLFRWAKHRQLTLFPWRLITKRLAKLFYYPLHQHFPVVFATLWSMSHGSRSATWCTLKLQVLYSAWWFELSPQKKYARHPTNHPSYWGKWTKCQSNHPPGYHH